MITRQNRHLVGYTDETIENFVIPSTIKINGILHEVCAIDDNAFSMSDNLISITIPASVKRIGIGILWGSAGGKTIIYEGTIAEWNSIDFHEWWNSTCKINMIICSDGSFVPPPGHSD